MLRVPGHGNPVARHLGSCLWGRPTREPMDDYTTGCTLYGLLVGMQGGLEVRAVCEGAIELDDEVLERLKRPIARKGPKSARQWVMSTPECVENWITAILNPCFIYWLLHSEQSEHACSHKEQQ